MTQSQAAGQILRLSQTVSGRIDRGILIVTIDNPPVNAASRTVRLGLLAAMSHALTSDSVHAVVVTGAGRILVGGADIKELDGPIVEPSLPQIVEAIEGSNKPVVAAINGAALGGGCEIAMACHFRIASLDAKFGLPEVKLGIVPGAGGTQRLPRLVGAQSAAQMIATGSSITADEALQSGLIDRITEGDVVAEAVITACNLSAASVRRTGDLAVPLYDRKAFDTATAKLLSRSRGETAPGEAIRLVGLAVTAPFVGGLAEERETFLRLRGSDQAKALRHVFFAERAAAKIPWISDVKPRAVKVMGIVGAGLMGSGIAVAALDAGLNVVCVEQSMERVDAGRERIEALLDRAVVSGRLDQAGRTERLGRLMISARIEDLSAADLIVEAVFDDPTVKSVLFATLDRVARPDAILATNTSYLDPDALAAVTTRPERVLGMHFFSPAHIMRLVEVVRCARTSPDVLATVVALARRLGKLPIVSGVCEGFIGNRVFSAYRREAEFLVEDGALPHEVDAAMQDYGIALGPFAVFDMAGLEISWARRKRQATTRDPDVRYVEIADRLCEAGRFGQKTGRGWYAYPDGKRMVDPDVTAMIEDARAVKGIAARKIAPQEIVARLLSAMKAEGVALLAEAIAQRPGDIDLVMINGYGFPAHKGGPMFVDG